VAIAYGPARAPPPSTRLFATPVFVDGGLTEDTALPHSDTALVAAGDSPSKTRPHPGRCTLTGIGPAQLDDPGPPGGRPPADRPFESRTWRPWPQGPRPIADRPVGLPFPERSIASSSIPRTKESWGAIRGRRRAGDRSPHEKAVDPTASASSRVLRLDPRRNSPEIPPMALLRDWTNLRPAYLKRFRMKDKSGDLADVRGGERPRKAARALIHRKPWQRCRSNLPVERPRSARLSSPLSIKLRTSAPIGLRDHLRPKAGIGNRLHYPFPAFICTGRWPPDALASKANIDRTLAATSQLILEVLAHVCNDFSDTLPRSAGG